MCAGGGDGAETVEIDRVMRGESRPSWTTLSSAAGQTHTHTHTHLTALFRDYPCEPVPER